MPKSPYQAAKQQYPYRVTQKLRAAFAMGDQPNENLEGWLGYFHFEDPTIQRPNTLTYPSMNCFIPNKDKIVPRLGSSLLGQAYTTGKSWPVIGHLKRFATIGGYEVEMRVSKSDDTNLKDIIEILYPNPATQALQWYQITQNVNPLPVGAHRYYFDSWFDTNLNPAESLNLARAIWVNGYQDPSTKLGAIYSWSGGIAPIVSIVSGVSISTTTGITWASLGIVDPLSPGILSYTAATGTFIVGDIVTGGSSGATGKVITVDPLTLILRATSGVFTPNETITGSSGATGKVSSYTPPQTVGTGNVVVNGVLYTVTGGWETSTLTVTSTAGISVNDVATSQIQVNTAPIPFDVCRQNKNYMFYGSWNSRQLYMSNGFSKDATVEITDAQAVQNDLVVGTSPYTGTGQHVYRVTIDSVNPPQSTQTFVPGGGGGLDDASYTTSGYTGTPGATNTYKVLVVADFTLVTPTNTFTPGEVLKGGTSGALARYVQGDINGSVYDIGVAMISGAFQNGETVTGQSSGHTEVPTEVFYQNWIQLYKNTVLTTITSSPITGTTVPLFNSPDTVTLVDGLTITFGNYYGHAVGDYFQLVINQGGADTFQYQVDGGTPIVTKVPITGMVQTLNNGVTISFVSTTGHTLGDYWDITVTQAVTNGWTNFYYTLPTRIPGEGYIYQLSSNFWTMAPQEAEMYVNTKYGTWSYVDTILSSNQQTETVSLTPLKQASANKVIFPYMLGYLDNDLIYVTADHMLNLIGRKELIQLPHISTLSQAVQTDFNNASFLDGSMEYQNQKLWLTSPHDGLMFVYDDLPDNKYWQPPQVIPENGILSTVSNNGVETLISHSFLRNQTNSLFVSTSGDNKSNYTVIARSAYLSKGERWGKKNANATFLEGYVTGAPPMKFNAIMGINGCGGIRSHDIKPIPCIATSRAPFGEGSFGSHANGSSPTIQNNYWNEIYQQYKPILSYYFIALELTCTTTNHSYEWLTMGINSVINNTGNIKLKNKEILSQQ